MKNFKNLLLILLLGFMAVTFSAIASEKVILFKNSTTDANWPKFEKMLIEAKKISNGKIDTKILATIAHSHLPSTTMTLEKFTPLWLLQNNLGEEISVTEFRNRAQAGEFQMIDLANLPAVPVEVKAQPVAEVAPVLPKTEPPVMTLEEKSVLQKATADSEAGLKNLKAEIAKLSKQVKASAVEKQKLAKLQADFKNLLEREQYYVTGDDVTMMMDETKNKLAALDTQSTNALLAANTALDDVALIKSSPLVKWGNKAAFVLLGLVGLLFLGLFLIWNGLRKSKNAVQNGFNSVRNEIQTIKTEQLIMKQATYRYDFNQELVKAEALRGIPVGESLDLKLTDLNSNNLINLKIERTGENQVTIHGASRDHKANTSLVVDSLSKVISALRRADLQGRIIEGGWVEPTLNLKVVGQD